MQSRSLRAIRITTLLLFACAVAMPCLAAGDDDRVAPDRGNRRNVDKAPASSEVTSDALGNSMAPTLTQTDDKVVKRSFLRSTALQLLDGLTSGSAVAEERRASPINPGVGLPPGQGGDIPGQGATPPDHSNGQGNGRPAKEDKDKDKDK